MFIVAFLAIHTTIVLIGLSPVLQGELVDTDGYMRALRVERLLETGEWFDGLEPRSNAPYGEASHWTRPLDAILAAVALPLTPFLGIRDAVYAAAVVALPLLTLLIYLGGAWAVGPLVGTAAALLVPVAILAQPMVAAYSVPGRVDHHPLILLLFVLALGHLVRALSADEEARGARAAGILAGLGLWVSTEFLAPLALFFGALAVGWVVRGASRARTGLRFSVSLAASVAVAVLMEHGPAGFLLVEYDRISLPHLLMATLATAFWAAGLELHERVRSAPRRALFAGGGALTAGAVMGVAFPSFFGGPWVNVDPAITDLWLRHVSELHPLLPGRGGDAGSIILYLGPVLVALPWLAFRTIRARGTPELPSWGLLALGLAGFTVLALLQRRWSTYAEVLAAIGLASALVPALNHLDRIGYGPARLVARVGLVGTVLLGFPLLGGALLSASPSGTAPNGSGCSLAPALSSLPGNEVHTILALMDFGPEILYRSPHRVVATPYHRNQGIADSHRILAAMTVDEARGALERREVDVILLCPARDRAFFGRASEELPEPSLYTRLTEGEPPPWVRPLAFPEESGFQAFQVDR